VFDQDYSDFFCFNEGESEYLSDFDVEYGKADIGLMTNRAYAKETSKTTFLSLKMLAFLSSLFGYPER
jgi:hypothetical protein